jgi:hypothetical protein
MQTLTSHIVLSFPTKALPPFTLTHHLYASTSSLLPFPSTWPPQLYNRSLLSILALTLPPTSTPDLKQPIPQQDSTKTYLFTSTPNPVPSNITTPSPQPTSTQPTYHPTMTESDRRQQRIRADEDYKAALSAWQAKCVDLAPNANAAITYSTTGLRINSPESFIGMVNAKMQALWSLRATEKVEGWGVLVTGKWSLRIGEVKGSIVKSGSMGVSSTRGFVVELTWHEGQGEGEVDKEEEALMRAFLERIFDGTGVSVEGTRRVVAYTADEAIPKAEDKPDKDAKGADWRVAELYAELLRTRS